jgi:hypothetical protein
MSLSKQSLMRFGAHQVMHENYWDFTDFRDLKEISGIRGVFFGTATIK